ncbi:hypothetical protein MMC30_002604 [Trapelia coarctata]|nr:hypothetical protein [Trapelia coarctata]
MPPASTANPVPVAQAPAPAAGPTPVSVIPTLVANATWKHQQPPILNTPNNRDAKSRANNTKIAAGVAGWKAFASTIEGKERRVNHKDYAKQQEIIRRIKDGTIKPPFPPPAVWTRSLQQVEGAWNVPDSDTTQAMKRGEHVYTNTIMKIQSSDEFGGKNELFDRSTKTLNIQPLDQPIALMPKGQRMLSAMGYTEGKGLGAHEQGRLSPIPQTECRILGMGEAQEEGSADRHAAPQEKGEHNLWTHRKPRLSASRWY